MPVVGDKITVALRGEITRAQVERVVTSTAVIATVIQFTTRKIDHGYDNGSIIPCLFEESATPGHSGWRAVSDAELDNAVTRTRKAEKDAAKKAKVKKI